MQMDAAQMCLEGTGTPHVPVMISIVKKLLINCHYCTLYSEHSEM
jgi:hypothetical protein